jgi:hypothetical protein
VYDAQGPFVSLFLDTSRGTEDAAQRLALRWKNLHGELQERGVPESTLAAMDPLIDGAQHAGAALALIAGVDGVLHVEALPAPPAREVLVREGPVPYLLPLLARVQSLVPHVAVLTDRAGADIAARLPDGEGPAEHVAGERSPQLSRSAPGGWSQPRYQHRAEVAWESNAQLVATKLTEVVDRVRPRFIAAAGDVRALQLLREQSPKRVRELVQVVGGELASLEAVFRAADGLVAATAAADTRALVDRFAEERGQGDRAVEGVGPVLAALARAQVDTLLLHDRPDDERTAWFGDGAGQLAADRDELLGMGVAAPAEGRLVDLAVRAALRSGAAVRVLGEGEGEGLADDLGALLRFPGG